MLTARISPPPVALLRPAPDLAPAPGRIASSDSPPPRLLDRVRHALQAQHVPVVMTRDEVRSVLQHLDGVPRLLALLFYVAGLRLLEGARLHVQDIDFAANVIVVRDGKGPRTESLCCRLP